MTRVNVLGRALPRPPLVRRDELAVALAVWLLTMGGLVALLALR
jgi:hypothetical protein